MKYPCGKRKSWGHKVSTDRPGLLIGPPEVPSVTLQLREKGLVPNTDLPLRLCGFGQMAPALTLFQEEGFGL